MCPFTKTKCTQIFLNKTDFLRHLDFWTHLVSLTLYTEEEGALKTWSNLIIHRLPRQTSKLGGNGAFALSVLGLGTELDQKVNLRLSEQEAPWLWPLLIRVKEQ